MSCFTSDIFSTNTYERTGLNAVVPHSVSSDSSCRYRASQLASHDLVDPIVMYDFQGYQSLCHLRNFLGGCRLPLWSIDIVFESVC